jgi:hypothetical protein
VRPHRHGDVWDDDEVVFRTLAAPGLEEDDLFAVRAEAPPGSVWGDGLPPAFAPSDETPDSDAERRRRHERLLAKWDPTDGPAAAR